MNLPIVTPVWNRRNVKIKSEIYPVHLRVLITPLPCRHYPIETTVNFQKDQLSGKDGACLKVPTPYYFEISNRITELISKIRAITKRYYMHNEPINFNTLKREINRKGEELL